MIKTGKEHLQQLRDGRIVYIGEEKISDVTKHPSLKRAAKTVAELYDLKHSKQYFGIVLYLKKIFLCLSQLRKTVFFLKIWNLL